MTKLLEGDEAELPLTGAVRTDRSLVGRRFGRGGLMVLISAIAVALLISIMFVPMPRETLGVLILLAMLSLMAVGVPIAIAMLVPSVMGLLTLVGPSGAVLALQDTPFNAVASWSMSVIPAFVLLGVILWKSGLTQLVYDAARNWLGNVPGGLAIGTNFAGAGLASASGSTIGISYALGKIAIPEMLKAGYKPSISTATVAMAGTLGQIIPPSVLLVIYAGIVQTPVGPQLMAGIVPGAALALVFGLYIFIRASLDKTLAPKSNLQIPLKTKVLSLTGILPVVLVVIIVIGGMFSGFFTATEAAAVGALAAALVAPVFAKGIRSPKAYGRFIRDSLVETVSNVAGLFLLLMAVTIMSKVLTLTRVTHQVTDLVLGMNLDRVGLLLILILFYLLLGMFLDPLAMMLITLPVLMVPLETLGVDLIWFGIFMIIMAEVAMVTPPVGILAFIVHNLAQDKKVNLGHEVPLIDVFRGLLGFVAVTLAFVVLIIFVPEIVTWLPGTMATP